MLGTKEASEKVEVTTKKSKESAEKPKTDTKKVKELQDKIQKAMEVGKKKFGDKWKHFFY